MKKCTKWEKTQTKFTFSPCKELLYFVIGKMILQKLTAKTEFTEGDIKCIT